MKRTRVNLREIVRPQGVMDAERRSELVTCLRCHARAVVNAPGEGEALSAYPGTPADQWKRLHLWQAHGGTGPHHFATERVPAKGGVA